WPDFLQGHLEQVSARRTRRLSGSERDNLRLLGHRCRVLEFGAVDRSSTGASGATILVARGRAMAERVSTIDVRQRIGDLLNRVALRHDEFVIERKGKPLAALVPIERLEQMRRFARRHALELLEKQKQSPVTQEQALEIALEAQRSARRRVRK